MKSTLFYSYIALGLGICIIFGVAAKAGWRMPISGFHSGGGAGYYGRSFGGTWGGGK